MMPISHTPQESLLIVKDFQADWKPSLEPYLVNLMRIKALKQCTFLEATLFWCKKTNSQYAIIKILAAYQYIMDQKTELQTLQGKINQFNNQLHALNTAKNFAPIATAELRDYYQKKLTALIEEKDALIKHNEATRNIEVICKTVVSNSKNKDKWN
ncbi:hypothetical protein [Thalassobellus citreus]|uniref:hypothetical protein n=1 Tax=Thalassobellus citreus TaxID=3367752 RepID=UPI0037A36BF7